MNDVKWLGVIKDIILDLITSGRIWSHHNAKRMISYSLNKRYGRSYIMKKSDIFGEVVSVIVITFGGSLQFWTATYNKTKAVRVIQKYVLYKYIKETDSITDINFHLFIILKSVSFKIYWYLFSGKIYIAHEHMF